MNDQPRPVKNESTPIADLVALDLQKRKWMGTLKYGTPLQAHNGRAALQDAYEELLDLAQYLRQEIEERKQNGFRSLDALAKICHTQSRAMGWWPTTTVPELGEVIAMSPELICTKLMLTVSEISEAMEGVRKNAQDDKLPHRSMVEVELADAVIRIFDLAGAMNLNVVDAMIEKLEYNRKRADHQLENRQKEGGKKF